MNEQVLINLFALILFGLALFEIVHWIRYR